MITSALGQLLILLATALLVVAAFRRLRLPPILGYLAVGMVLGPQALNMAGNETITHALSEFGVVFLVFTLGLEFSLPRMVAMRWEVFGLGGAQMLITTALLAVAFFLNGASAPIGLVLGGALAMSSTAIVVRQLTEQGEMNRTHSRIAIGILLFQDLAFVPLLALQSALAAHQDSFDLYSVLIAVLRAALALMIVLAAGRWLMRPLFHEISRTRSTDLFTLAVLLVSLGSAWLTHAAGLSMALGAFLAGMLLAETEYRHQIEVVIRPFRDILLGLFFITVGTLLDLRALFTEVWLVLMIVLSFIVVKAAVVAVTSLRTTASLYKSLRAGLVIAQGGEFGFALLTLMLNAQLADHALLQPLLAATVLSMALSPILIRYNEQIAAFVTRHKKPARSDLLQQAAVIRQQERRDHVILCGYGRVGQNVARVLEQQGIEYVALDMDSRRVRDARQAGDPVIYGDAAHGEILEAVGLEHCRIVVITFSEADVALGILRTLRALRAEVPVLVRTQDDSKLDLLQKAGATEVVPETLEASLMLISHVLLLLGIPVSRVVKTVGDIRNSRYGLLRKIFRKDDARTIDATHVLREQLQTLVLPPKAYAVGKTIADLQLKAAGTTITAVRREGIVGPQPADNTILREGDVLTLYGTPEAIERGEARLLMG